MAKNNQKKGELFEWGILKVAPAYQGGHLFSSRLDLPQPASSEVLGRVWASDGDGALSEWARREKSIKQWVMAVYGEDGSDRVEPVTPGFVIVSFTHQFLRSVKELIQESLQLMGDRPDDHDLISFHNPAIGVQWDCSELNGRGQWEVSIGPEKQALAFCLEGTKFRTEFFDIDTLLTDFSTQVPGVIRVCAKEGEIRNLANKLKLAASYPCVTKEFRRTLEKAYTVNYPGINAGA